MISKFPDATHHCYAYRIDPLNLNEFSHDDGEPSGTAGLPILNKLKSFNAVNVGIIVVRYYGGTNLGKSGLIEAYGTSAEECLNQATFREIAPVRIVEVHYPYNQQNVITKLELDYNLKEQEAEYLASVKKSYACKEDLAQQFIDELKNLEHLSIDHKVIGHSFLPI